jgi:hypothetical protein
VEIYCNLFTDACMVWLLICLRENFYIFLYNMELHSRVEVSQNLIFILFDSQTSKFCPVIPNYVTQK